MEGIPLEWKKLLSMSNGESVEQLYSRLVLFNVSSTGIQFPVAVVLEMRADMERLALVNNLGSRIAEDLTL